MAVKSAQLQIRLTRSQKRRLRRLATASGQDVSSYVLGRVLPDEAAEFAAILGQFGGGGDESLVLAGLHDFLQGLAPVDFAIATATADRSRLSAFQANHVAAMVELAASARGVAPPAWAAEVAPLDTPYFATPLARLRLHLLGTSPELLFCHFGGEGEALELARAVRDVWNDLKPPKKDR